MADHISFVKLDGKIIRFDMAINMLLDSQFLQRKDSNFLHQLYSFCEKRIRTLPPSSLDIKYVCILAEYMGFLSEAEISIDPTIVNTSLKLIKRIDFSDLKTDNQRTDYYVSWGSNITNQLRFNINDKMARKLFKELISHIRSHRHLFDNRGSSRGQFNIGSVFCEANSYFVMGMAETTLSPFPTPLGRGYLSKAAKLFRKCGNEGGASHCLYKQAEWIMENCEGLMRVQYSSRNMSERKFQRNLMKSLKEAEIMINECIEISSRDINEPRNVLLNMKHVKVRILHLLSRKNNRKALQLLNLIIEEGIRQVSMSHVLGFGYLVTKARILEELGMGYYWMAIQCFKHVSRYLSSMGRKAESEEAKMEMHRLKSELKKSRFNPRKLKRVPVLPVKSCSYPHCGKMEDKNVKFKCCARCKSNVYCCRTCQMKDWKLQHRNECKKWKKKVDKKVVEERIRRSYEEEKNRLYEVEDEEREREKLSRRDK